MDYREKILGFIKVKGPVLPVQISREIGSNILMASAHLAELTANGKLKVSAIKVGGSPLYYIPGQEEMLQRFTENMNDKEKKAFDLLMQSKILRDSEQEPVIRVALREIKDFAVPLNVSYGDNKEVFWKWHLMPDTEAEQAIKSKMNLTEKPAEKIIKEQAIVKEQAQDKPSQDKTEELQKEAQESSQKEKKPRQKAKEDDFFGEVAKFFEKNKINVLSSELVKKNSEMDFVVEIPSVVGSLQYYCKAKNKKSISDSDLSNAYVKGQFRKLPVIVVSTGDLSAKAREMVKKELNSLTFKKI